jgi:EAL domain-containing protein (putative c-di-GMP-specific phosphodiesterase class I)
MEDESRARRDLDTDLRRALTLGEFSLVYRPCGDVSSRSLTGFEARLHWYHPVRGVVPEAEFIQLGEATGFIVALGEWALRNACLDAASWLAPLTVATRVSARQLSDPDRLTESVRLALAASGLAPGRLQLKVPESALLGHEDQVLSTLHRLRALGVSIALVDFAIGPSLLNRLRSLPFQAVAFEGDNPSDIAADADKSSVLCALAAAGFDHIGCYFGDLLSSTPGIADVVRLQATTGKPASAAE